jgi:ribosomal protein S27E
LLRKKRVPQRKFYGADYGSDLDRKNENVHAYSSYNINTISYTSHNTINYTEINISDENNAEEKVEEPQRKVSVSCPGCGAKTKVYRKQYTDCEYCGTTVEAS